MTFFDAWKKMEDGAGVCRPGWDKIALFYLREGILWAVYRDQHEKRMTVVPTSIICANDWEVKDPDFLSKVRTHEAAV